jgi:hypothetical protein
VDVAGSAAIEIARSRVVNSVSASPEVVRREGEYTDHTSDVVYDTVMEEGAVTAIVTIRPMD